MKSNVNISIRGMQNDSQEETVEVVSFGEMYERNNQIYVSYEEASDEEAGADCDVIKSLMKVCPGQVEIIKRGAAETHMVFVEGKDTISYYSTPFGEMEVSIHTDQLEKMETERGFQILLKYALEINSAHVSDCNVDIRVEQRNAGT